VDSRLRGNDLSGTDPGPLTTGPQCPESEDRSIIRALGSRHSEGRAVRPEESAFLGIQLTPVVARRGGATPARYYVVTNWVQRRIGLQATAGLLSFHSRRPLTQLIEPIGSLESTEYPDLLF
jgi:hypothetical protein